MDLFSLFRKKKKTVENTNKTKLIIIGIYLIHLVLFIIISYFIKKDINDWNDTLLRLKISPTISYHNHIYIIIFFIIESFCSVIKALNIYINKKLVIVIVIAGALFALIGAYKYFDLKSYLDSLNIAVGLIISLNVIYGKINISESVK